jgi:hypothetical protein
VCGIPEVWATFCTCLVQHGGCCFGPCCGESFLTFNLRPVECVKSGLLKVYALKASNPHETTNLSLIPDFFFSISSASQTTELFFLQSGEVTALPTVTHNWGWSDWSNFTGF